jgi:hypothetical protein
MIGRVDVAKGGIYGFFDAGCSNISDRWAAELRRQSPIFLLPNLFLLMLQLEPENSLATTATIATTTVVTSLL